MLAVALHHQVFSIRARTLSWHSSVFFMSCKKLSRGLCHLSHVTELIDLFHFKGKKLFNKILELIKLTSVQIIVTFFTEFTTGFLQNYGFKQMTRILQWMCVFSHTRDFNGCLFSLLVCVA